MRRSRLDKCIELGMFDNRDNYNNSGEIQSRESRIDRLQSLDERLAFLKLYQVSRIDWMGSPVALENNCKPAHISFFPISVVC
ncbi:hypothetical protein RRG08_046767 [Elysia crispata]|uniref:Uncharacterized protein n=1 Tax=Elysia crispata TaxID=231223 RepID=A0AAE1DN89_9GAST|nr:hypothetical protein RRG08_046767 [Elysia crispata]